MGIEKLTLRQLKNIRKQTRKKRKHPFEGAKHRYLHGLVRKRQEEMERPRFEPNYINRKQHRIILATT